MGPPARCARLHSSSSWPCTRCLKTPEFIGAPCDRPCHGSAWTDDAARGLGPLEWQAHEGRVLQVRARCSPTLACARKSSPPGCCVLTLPASPPCAPHTRSRSRIPCATTSRPHPMAGSGGYTEFVDWLVGKGIDSMKEYDVNFDDQFSLKAPPTTGTAAAPDAPNCDRGGQTWSPPTLQEIALAAHACRRLRWPPTPTCTSSRLARTSSARPSSLPRIGVGYPLPLVCARLRAPQQRGCSTRPGAEIVAAGEAAARDGTAREEAPGVSTLPP